MGDAHGALSFLKLAQSVADRLDFCGIGWGVGEEELVIADCFVGVVLSPGDLAESVGNLEGIRVSGL
jgi:hypothetical protein